MAKKKEVKTEAVVEAAVETVEETGEADGFLSETARLVAESDPELAARMTVEDARAIALASREAE